MQYNHTFRDFLNRNLYLLMLAAWLITIAIIIDNYWAPNASLHSVQKKLTSSIQKSEKEISRLVNNTSFLNSIKNGEYDENFIKKLAEKPYFTFFYKYDSTGQLHPLLWSTQQVLPYPWLFYLEAPSKFIRLSNGYYIVNTIRTNGMLITALIPLKWNYIIVNEHLKNGFAIGGISDEYDVTTEETGAAVNSMYGNRLFNVIQKRAPAIRDNNIIAVCFILIAFLLILFFVHLLSNYTSIPPWMLPILNERSKSPVNAIQSKIGMDVL